MPLRSSDSPTESGTAHLRVGDRLLEVVVISVAWWSLLYWLGWSLHVSLWPFSWVWAVGTAAIVVWAVRDAATSNRSTNGPPDSPEDGPDTNPGNGPDTDEAEAGTPGLWRRLGTVAAVLSIIFVVALIPATSSWPSKGFAGMWVCTLLALGLGGLAVLLRGPALGTRWREPGVIANLVAAALSLAIGVLSLFIHLPDNDDPYYVNRSVWIAEHGTAMIRDTMFGPGIYKSPYNGGIPIASFEGLIGVLSHLSGISVGTLTWVVTTFIASTATTWAFWALARRWAPRRPLVVLTVAVAFMLMSGESRLGNFWIARIWQGKVIALVVLLPLVLVWADDAVRTRSRRPLVLLAIGGVAFAGLTSTSVILAPFLSGGMILTALLIRERRLALGGVLFLIGPLATGIAVVAVAGNVGGTDPALLSGGQTFGRVLGSSAVMVVLALIGLAAAPLIVRTRQGALMVATTMAATLVLLIPSLLTEANKLTGSGPILWRVLYCVPLAVLVGLLAVIRIPKLGPGNLVLAVVMPVGLLLVIGHSGAPLWNTVDHNGPVTLQSSPTAWKVDPTALSEVQEVMSTDPHGVVLLPPTAMRVLPMYTTKVFAVDPRDWYSRILQEAPGKDAMRLELKRFAGELQPIPSSSVATRALKTLGVTTACVQDGTDVGHLLTTLRSAGYTDEHPFPTMTCLAKG